MLRSANSKKPSRFQPALKRFQPDFRTPGFNEFTLPSAQPTPQHAPDAGARREPKLELEVGMNLAPIVFPVLTLTGGSADIDQLLSQYNACSDRASVQVLTHGEATACMEAYMRIKLHFAGVSPVEYFSMTPSERATVNRNGYLGYKSWQLDSPDAAQAPQS